MNIVYERIIPINEDDRKIIDAALAPLGFRVRGQWFQQNELLLECFDVDIAPKSKVDAALWKALEPAEVAAAVQKFKNVFR